ncbi:MAG: hypothetical protein IRZ32_18350, partial [Solirubrobacteraceae bacterium]|nr:hypothetical protein [Solirubrobacteraceae bacterium]
MESLVRRIRWGNVAATVAVAALAGTLVAWPRLAPRDPPLPPAQARPVAPSP